MPTELPQWVPADLDLDRPNAARVYDYLLGGACNFKQDRDFADKLLETIPEAVIAARSNRSFLGRAVRFCVAQGVRQFLDLGSGIPTVGNVHEIAQHVDPSSRVVYVDSEPIAIAHSQLILEHNERAEAFQADLMDPEAVLGAEPVRRLLDFTEPMAVLLAAVLHFVPDSADPAKAVGRYVEAMPPGSYLVLSHAAKVSLQRSQDGWKLYDQSTTPGGGRTLDQVRDMFAGTELVEPGVVWAPLWRPDLGIIPESPEMSFIYAGVSRKL